MVQKVVVGKCKYGRCGGGGGFKRENKLGARGWEGGNSCRVVASSFLFINHEMRLLLMLNVLLLSL